MFRENTWYGHNRCLGLYAGLPSPPPIWGYMQHGWQPGDGFSPYRPPVALPLFVWNGVNLAKAKAAGFPNVTAIAAPFLYLLRHTPDVGSGSGGTIAYPFHSWERQDVAGDHRTYAQELVEREGPSLTICLYWREYEDPKIRRFYEETGARIICHGTRTEPHFVERQVTELRRHKRVVSNRASTAIWYGGAAGLEVELYGPTMGVGGLQEGITFDRFQRESWPELFSGPLHSTAAQELANRELGAEYFMDPDELKDVMGWTGWRRAAGPALRRVVRAAQRIRSKTV